MRIRGLLAGAAAAAGLMLGGAAQAAVTYAFSTGAHSFVYESPDFVTAPRVVDTAGLEDCVSPADNCTINFFPALLGPTDLSTLSFLVVYPDVRITSGYYFEAGAFSTVGAYDTLFGNTASLTVSGAPDVGVVPEPSAWALMILGFGLAGHAMRRREVRTAL
ncbi:MAG: PEPxxWA-CTERM sorting domain-containing protein [Phenylobacterium sp.]|nr:PEPxxWA-CTERM sorting domain-containing protein [Phenylobacterium sp.]